MAQDIAQRNANLPEYLRDKTKANRIGNIDSTDLVIPRVKLIQKVDPIVDEFEAAKPGEFWHTILNESLGKSLIGIPIVLRKSHVLWAPRGDDRGILARSRDAIHWDPPEGEFQVKFKGNPTSYTWKLAPTVAESRLDQFGSSRTDDPNSPPASALTYELLWWFPERSDIGPAIILNSRGAVKAAQRLLSMIDAKPVDHFYQMYSIGSVPVKTSDGDNYLTYTYAGLGYADEVDGDTARVMFERFKDVAFRASDERTDSDAPTTGHAGQTAQRSADSKF